MINIIVSILALIVMIAFTIIVLVSVEEKRSYEMKEKEKEIIEYYGVMPQLKHLQGEMFELIEAVINYEKEMTKDNISHIIEELADVQVMIDQLKTYYKVNDVDLNKEMEYKVNRQISRIAGENNG